MKPLRFDDVGLVTWERFLEDGTRGHDPVFERWARARRLGADPEGRRSNQHVDTPQQLRLRMERLEALLRVGDPVLGSTASAMADRDFLMLLADADGVVLGLYGGGQFLSAAQQVKLVEGSHWSESVRGTNGIGTALAEGQAVVVDGTAHFERVNHGLVCYAHPIRDVHGEIIAVLDATSFLSNRHDFVPVAVHAAATSIERALHAMVAEEVGAPSLRVISRVIERCGGPAMVLERPGMIRMANNQARALPVVANTGNPTITDLLGVTWSELEARLASGQHLADMGVMPGPLNQHNRLHFEALPDRNGRLWAAMVFVDPVRLAVAGGRASQRASAFGELLGTDEALRETVRVAERLATSRVPVLIEGEGGTGKSTLAQAIYRASDRASGPLMTVDCGTLNMERLQNKLVGEGSGTGSVQQMLGETLLTAHKGVLLLEDLDLMDRGFQDLLYLTLDQGVMVQGANGQREALDMRIVATSRRDLGKMVEAGSFRGDLYHRLGSMALKMPPLRSRDDFEVLAEGLLQRMATVEGIAPVPTISPEVMEALLSRSWSGNVRELKLVLHHGLVMSDGASQLRPEHMPDGGDRTPLPEALQSGEQASLSDLEAVAIQRALDEVEGNISRAASRLGVARSTLYRMIKRHNLR